MPYLVIVAPLLVIFGWPLVILCFYLQYLLQFNPIRAETTIAELGTRIELKFYSLWDENTDAGRYLTARSPVGDTKIKMTAFDWANNARTSVYLTEDRKIAILGPTGDDYLFAPGASKSVNPGSAASDKWTYLGAFDFAFLTDEGRKLSFIPAGDQAECIPMLQSEITGKRVRQAARQPNCNRHQFPPVPRPRSASNLEAGHPWLNGY